MVILSLQILKPGHRDRAQSAFKNASVFAIGSSIEALAEGERIHFHATNHGHKRSQFDARIPTKNHRFQRCRNYHPRVEIWMVEFRREMIDSGVLFERLHEYEW